MPTQKSLFLLLSAVFALSLSHPLPEPQIFSNAGEILAALTRNEPEQLWLIEQQPSDFIIMEPLNLEEKPADSKANADCEGCENQPENLERSFFFKNWFSRPSRPVAATVTFVQPVRPAAPQVIRVPSPGPVVLGTIYQPISLVAGALTPGSGLISTGISSPFTGTTFPGHVQQGTMTGSRPPIQIMTRPQSSMFPLPSGQGSNLGMISIQQIMRPGVGLHQGITAAGSSSLSSASASTLQGTGGSTSEIEPNTETMSTFESHKVPRPETSAQINIDKVIDVMGQVERT